MFRLQLNDLQGVKVYIHITSISYSDDIIYIYITIYNQVTIAQFYEL
jgi:hypothetical protein